MVSAISSNANKVKNRCKAALDVGGQTVTVRTEVTEQKTELAKSLRSLGPK